MTANSALVGVVVLAATAVAVSCGGGGSGTNQLTLTDDSCSFKGDQTPSATKTYEADVVNQSSKLGAFEIAKIDPGHTFDEVKAYVESQAAANRRRPRLRPSAHLDDARRTSSDRERPDRQAGLNCDHGNVGALVCAGASADEALLDRTRSRPIRLASRPKRALSWFVREERRSLGRQTQAGVKRAQGIQLGRPREISEGVVQRVGELHATGLSVAAIARKLDENVPTSRGGRWHSPGVNRALTWVRP